MDLWSPFLRDSTSTGSSPSDGAGKFQFTCSGMWVTALVLNSLGPTLETPPTEKKHSHHHAADDTGHGSEREVRTCVLLNPLCPSPALSGCLFGGGCQDPCISKSLSTAE